MASRDRGFAVLVGATRETWWGGSGSPRDPAVPCRPVSASFGGSEPLYGSLVGPVSDKMPNYLATATPEVDFALVLARVIDAVNQDPAELRNAIYELARIKLQREGWRHDPPIDIAQMRQLTRALEIAIERVEVLSSRRDEQRALRSLDRLIKRETPEPSLKADQTLVLIENGAADVNASRFYNGSPGEPTGATEVEPRDSSADGWGSVAARPHDALIQDAAPTASLVSPAGDAHSTGAPDPRWYRVVRAMAIEWPRLGGSPLARTLLVLVGVVGFMLLISQHTEWFRPPSRVTAVMPGTKPDVAVAPSDPKVPVAAPPQQDTSRQPLPDAYGVYAISNGELFELEALPGRAPDPRIALSALITRGSRTVVPDGRVSFVAYRRDFSRSAPDRVSVRVIAKIMRAMTYNSGGKAQISAIEDEWIMRNISYDFKVAPVASNSEMMALQPTEAPVLPAGRYGLVINGATYDFAVAGDITEPAQCLERVAAANGSFYSQCRKP